MWHMQPFVVNGHDRIVFPSNFVPELDLSVMNSLAQLDAVIRRDFEVKAPSGTDILNRVQEGAYASRYELMRDRSEERRVGKECRSRWSPAHSKTRSAAGEAAGFPRAPRHPVGTATWARAPP